MTENDTQAVEGIDLTTERAVQALTECMSVLPGEGGIHAVISSSGSEYAVDAHEGRCTCPDAEHNLAADEPCKHEIRTLVATGRVSVPAWIDLDAADEQLGIHADGPTVAAADGGAVVAGETADVADDRPAECECSGRPCSGLLGTIFWLTVILLTFGLALPLLWWSRRRRPRYIVTDRRVIRKKGRVSSSTDEFRLNDVSRIQTSRSLGERLRGAGSITVDTGPDD